MANDSTANLRAALTSLIARLSGEIKHLELAGVLRGKQDELQALLDDLPETADEERKQALASKIQLEQATLDVLVGTDQRAVDLKAEQMKFVNRLLFETPGGQRFTQDSPILPSVLIDFALEPRRQLELILTLKGDEGAGHAAMRLRQMIKAYREKLSKKQDDPTQFEREKPRISYIPGQIAVRLYFDEMMRVVLPLTPWWHDIYSRLRGLEKKYRHEPEGIKSADWYGFPMPDEDRQRDLFEALMVMRREIDPTADNILEDKDEIKKIVQNFQISDPEEREAQEARIGLERDKTRLEYVQQFPQDLSWFVRVIGLVADCFKSGTQLLQDPVGMSAVLKRDFDARRDSTNSSLIETKQEQSLRIADQSTSLFEARQNRKKIAGAFLELYRDWLDLSDFDPDRIDFDSNNRFPHEQMIWRITKNRPVHLAVSESALTIKADAARRLFDVSCEKITWAVLDSGIDREHPAFRNTTERHEAVKLLEIQREMQDKLHDRRAAQRKKPETEEEAKRRDAELDKRLLEIERNRQELAPERLGSRIVQTLDFTKLRNLLEHELDFEDTGRKSSKMSDQVVERRDSIIAEIAGRMDGEQSERSRLRKAERILNDLRERIAKGYDINWRDLEAAIVVNHPEPPTNDHGTHVAGILGADWIEDFENERELPLSARSRKLVGICPEINLIDVRVFREDGLTDEFELLAAIQFLRWMNERAGSMKVHGANLSISLLHEVQLFACGQTPICDECNEATALGMVMVAAAGNRGFTQESKREIKQSDHYQSVSVTDPGNADGVITVGATHRKRPHEYGVSYFSSRGPTGDGRMKPDLVAPGEKIMGPTPNKRMEVKDGTSMAAPHVSGAAAMLMARHTELIGNPQRIKQILCETATDLGRERYFQGHGLVDALRALQSV